MVEIVKIGGSNESLSPSPNPPGSDGGVEARQNLAAGTKLLVTGPDAHVDGLSWRSVRDPSGNQGWILADKLVPIASAVLATSATTSTTSSMVAPSAIEFTGEFDRSALSVGGKLTIALHVTNRGDRPIDGVRIYSEGPWAAFAVERVGPSGIFDRGMVGTYEVRQNLPIQPGETASITIDAIPNQPGNHTFSFVPFGLDGSPLHTSDGRVPSLGEMISVSR